jgi:hypothetical protein
VKLSPLLVLRPPPLPPPPLLMLPSQRLGLNSPASGPKLCFAIAMVNVHSITTVPCKEADTATADWHNTDVCGKSACCKRNALGKQAHTAA